MRARAAVVGGVFVASVLAGSPAGATIAPAPRACDPIALPVYSVEAEAAAPYYYIGERAVIRVRVTMRTTGTPVSGAGVGLGLFTQGDGFLYAHGETGDNGKAVFGVTLVEDVVEPGPVTVMAYARRYIVNTVCGDAVLFGQDTDRNAFTARRR